MERSVGTARGTATGQCAATEWNATSDIAGSARPARAQTATHDGCDLQHDWQTVDRALRSIAKRRAGLDAEEARWLREAEALKIWRELGMVCALDYVERVLGYGPRTARERLRVARALGGLPTLSTALANGELSYSAVRELSRVATCATEADWLAHARGKNLREVEELVADHHLGDRPDDPKDPRARTHVVRLELSAETFALFRQARQVLDSEHGTSLSEDQLITQLCNAVLDGTPANEPTGRAKFQVAVTVCARCRQGWQHGAGAKIPIAPAALERVMCDAQHIGSIDGDAPARAHQDISPSVARFVWHRDASRCRVPGCRSARGLELHHLVHRADGGGHDASNIALLCSACHLAHHAGTLQISGTAEHLEVVRAAHSATDASPDHVNTMDVREAHARRGAPMAGHVAVTRVHVDPRSAREGLDRRDAPMAGHATGAQVHVEPCCARDGLDRRDAPMPGHATGAQVHMDTCRAREALDRRDAPMPGHATGAQVHVDTCRARDGLDRRDTPMAGHVTGAQVHVDTCRARDGQDRRDTPMAGHVTGAWVHVDTCGAREGLDRRDAPMPGHATGAQVHVDTTTTVDREALCADATAALKQAGWTPAIAQAAVRGASAALDASGTLEQLLVEALRRCRRNR